MVLTSEIQENAPAEASSAPSKDSWNAPNLKFTQIKDPYFLLHDEVFNVNFQISPNREELEHTNIARFQNSTGVLNSNGSP